MGTARGRNASLNALVDHMAETAIDPAGQTVFISHGDCEEDANKVAEDVKRRFGVQTVVLNNVGPVIGAHSGPGTVALFFLGEAPLMEDVKWLEVTLDTTEAELDALCARLTGNGVTGLAIEDEEDFKTFLEQNRQYWDYVDDGLLARMKGVCRVKFYITDDADGQKAA